MLSMGLPAQISALVTCATFLAANPLRGDAAGIVPTGSRIFMTVSGPENVCGPADANHNAFCAVAAGLAAPVEIPLTTYTDPRGANFGYITASASVTSGKTATGTTNSNVGPFEFISFNDTYTVHGTATGSFPIMVTLHITGSYGTVPAPVVGNQLTFEATQLEIGTFHPEATLTQFVVDPFPADAQNPSEAQFSQTHSTIASSTPVTLPLDVQVSYTKLVNVNDVFDMAYGIDLNLTGRGQINMVPTTDVISFALPEGVYLTSALGATFGTPPSLAGDYNVDGSVDAADYLVWRENEGTSNVLPNDPMGGMIGTAQYDQWRSHFGQTAGGGSLANGSVPEPTAFMLLTLTSAGWCLRRGRSSKYR